MSENRTNDVLTVNATRERAFSVDLPYVSNSGDVTVERRGERVRIDALHSILVECVILDHCIVSLDAQLFTRSTGLLGPLLFLHNTCIFGFQPTLGENLS